MKKYIFSLLLLFVATVTYGQHLAITTDLKGNFAIKIYINQSSITLDKMGNIKNISNGRCYCEDGDLKLISNDNLANKGRITRLEGYKVEYDFFTKNISKIGDLVISYDFHSKRISKIGDKEFKFNFHSERIEKIGNAEIKYDFFAEKIAQIGDVKFKYESFSNRLIYVGNDKFEYEYKKEDEMNDEDESYSASARDKITFSFDDIDFRVRLL